MVQLLHSNFGSILEKEILHEIVQVGTLKEVQKGQHLINIGNYIRFIPLLVEGVIKVLREDDNSDELLLYFLEKGQTCSMTMTCCLGNTQSQVRAVAETKAKLIMVPIEKMEVFMTKYPTWRNFVLNSYQNRFNELLLTVDSIAFLNMDQRLIEYLSRKAKVTQNQTIAATHQQIAYDLHSSRVVISRLLKKLEQLGKISLHRNQIILHF